MAKFRRRTVGPHSTHASLVALDSRTNIAKLLRKITEDLLTHLGDPTPPQRIIVQNAAMKTLRVALFADRILNDPNALSENSDHNILAWSNSLRLDLVALGLERREKPTLALASYMISKEAGKADDKSDDKSDNKTTDAAA